ncbi:MAG: hypothetical protein NC036_04150 [Muribaculaceae bacterium]|nr:hypothetical protein [Muribaculaceae bacterium]
MKKLLLLAALAASAFCASAQYYDMEAGSQIFSVEYNGQTVENGGKIICTDYEAYGEGDAQTYDYTALIKMINKTEEEQVIMATLLAVNPTYTQIKENVDTYGIPQLCYNGACLAESLGNFGMSSNVKIPVPDPNDPETEFEWHLTSEEMLPTASVTYRVSMIKFIDEEEPENNPEFYFDITFTADESGVTAVEIDENLPVEYYDLSGRRVVNPAQGLYILRQGNKAVKRVVR